MKKIGIALFVLIATINLNFSIHGMERIPKLKKQQALCSSLENLPQQVANPYTMIADKAREEKARKDKDMNVWEFLETLNVNEDDDGLPQEDLSNPLDPRWDKMIQESSKKAQVHDRKEPLANQDRPSSCPPLISILKKERNPADKKRVFICHDLDQFRSMEEEIPQCLTYLKSSKKYTREQIAEHRQRRDKRRSALASEHDTVEATRLEEDLFAHSTIDFSNKNLGSRETREVKANIEGIVRSCQDGVETVESLLFDNNQFHQCPLSLSSKQQPFQNLLIILQILQSFEDIKHVSFCGNKLNLLPSENLLSKQSPQNFSNPSHLSLGLFCYSLKRCPRLEYIDLRGNNFSQEQHDEIMEIIGPETTIFF